MEQYKTENAKLEKDLPTLREIVGGTWKKEDELKQLKSEVAVLERKIQLELKPPEKQMQTSSGKEEESQAISTMNRSMKVESKGIRI